MGGGEVLAAPQTARMQLLQKASVLVAKAALSSIPLAVFAFDIGQAGVDFANARLVDRLLQGLGDRVDRLEEEHKKRLYADPIYQISAQAALRRMLTETNIRMADALARAVAELGQSTLPHTERLEVARVLDSLNEPSLHLLQTFYRRNPSTLTEREIAHAGGVVAHDSHFSRIIVGSMSLISWEAPLKDLERLGLIKESFDFGELGESTEFETSVPSREVLPLGERVLRMCFDNPSIPAFGAFAVPIGTA